MALAGMLLDPERLIRRGFPMVRSGSVEFVESLDAFSFEDALTGQRCYLTRHAVEGFFNPTMDQESIVESGIFADCSECIEVG